MNHKNSFLLFLGLLSIVSSFSQEGYLPAPAIDELPPNTVSELLINLEKDIEQIPYTGKTKKLLRDLYRSRYDRMLDNAAFGLLLDSPELNELCGNILTEILDNNPDISQPVRVFVTRDPSPNARCLGDGTIFIHIGLLIRLETEAQLAFVICHELAHYQLDHVNNRYATYAVKSTDLAAQREIDRAIREADNPFEAMVSYFEGEAYEVHRHSRNKEIEADSVGLAYFLNTSFDVRGASSTMEVLDAVDEVKYQVPIPYKKLFGSLEQPFDDNWLIYQPSNNFVYGQHSFDLDWEIDSLATHPDCDKRRRLIQANLRMNRIEEPAASPEKLSSTFRDLEMANDLEWVISYFYHEAYGKALYFALQLTEVYPDEPFLHSLIGRIMVEIYLSKQAHNLGYKLDYPNPLRSEAYNQFLNFARSLRLKEWEAFCFEYMQARPESFHQNEEFLYSLVLASSLGNHDPEMRGYIQEYRQRFPDGWYINEMNAMEHGFDE